MMVSAVDLSEYIMNLIQSNATTLKIDKVTYGDVDRILYPVEVCVFPERKVNELKRAGMGLDITFTIYVIIYFSYVQNPELNQLYCDKIADSVEVLMKADTTFNHNVLNGIVTVMESGTARKNGVFVRANRLTIEAMSRDILPSS